MTRADAVTSITCLIVDDEPLARARLRALARETPWLQCVGDVASARTAIAAIDELTPDLVFLDIRMPGMSGLEVLGRVRHAPAVIFTTAYDAHAMTAFELGAIDYLLKPFGRDRFQRAMARARPMLERQVGGAGSERAAELLGGGALTRVFVREAGRIVPVPASAIERFEACDDFVVVHAGGRRYRLNLQLSDVEARMDARAFLRIHRSHLINLDHVIAIAPYDGSRYQVTLRGGGTLVASRQRSRVLRDLVRGTPRPADGSP
ncbi:MAG: LytTR family DNA-binding domain-containing protein [Vicinamibacterales bacterium]